MVKPAYRAPAALTQLVLAQWRKQTTIQNLNRRNCTQARICGRNLCCKSDVHKWCISNIYYNNKKISPVGDWRSTSLERPWPWPWIRPYGIPSYITHRPLPTYQISLRSEEKFFRRSPLRFWSSSESRDTKTMTNIKNLVRSNLDIVL